MLRSKNRNCFGDTRTFAKKSSDYIVKTFSARRTLDQQEGEKGNHQIEGYGFIFLTK